MRTLSDLAFSTGGTEPHTAFEMNNTRTVLDLVEFGRGVGFLPTSSRQSGMPGIVDPSSWALMELDYQCPGACVRSSHPCRSGAVDDADRARTGLEDVATWVSWPRLTRPRAEAASPELW